MESRDPVKCACRTNACTRVRGREGDRTRGYCQCRENGTPCTYLCNCGRGKYPCSNNQYVEEDDEDLIEYEDDVDDPLFKCDEQILTVFHGDDEISVNAGDTLHTSLQDLAVEQAELNASLLGEGDGLMQQEASEAKGRPTEEKRKSKPVQVQKPTEARRKKSAEVQRKADAELVKAKITKLPSDGLQTLVLKLADLYPDLVDMAMGPNPPEPPHHTLPDGWCKCHRCREMPTTDERLCCISKNNELCLLITSAGPISQLVLSKTALQVAVLNHNEYCIQNDDPDDNNTLRHMAYRKFVLWRRGYLGAGVRVVIPSCVVWAVRDRYPSPDGTYTGYKPLIY